jgi:hypothetical protein
LSPFAIAEDQPSTKNKFVNVSRLPKKKTDATGRDKKPWRKFSQVDYDMQKSAAFKSLSASAIRVLLWALVENYQAVTREGATGKPQFKLTNLDAQKEYGLNSATFSRAKNELHEKGFLEWAMRGGLKGVNGVCSTYRLSGKWKDWTSPPKVLNKNLEKARAARKEKKEATPHGKTIKSVKPA